MEVSGRLHTLVTLPLAGDPFAQRVGGTELNLKAAARRRNPVSAGNWITAVRTMLLKGG
jgi:hypothetical protein